MSSRRSGNGPVGCLAIIVIILAAVTGGGGYMIATHKSFDSNHPHTQSCDPGWTRIGDACAPPGSLNGDVIASNSP